MTTPPETAKTPTEARTPDELGVRERQAPLRHRYQTKPEDARITDRARTTGGTDLDPFHGRVVPGDRDYGVTWPFGIHRAVGGDHDAPNPGDLLCAALASCLDSTLRMMAEHLRVPLEFLEVDVTADVDVRGTLRVSEEVPVAFQRMCCWVDLRAAEDADPERVRRLLAAAEHSCINLQTLRSGVEVETRLAGEPSR